jgi:hypothetical protein
MARYLYSELANIIDAYKACIKMGNDEWTNKHGDRMDDLVHKYMPHGSGFDSGTRFSTAESHAEKLVFRTAFHHMNDVGYYDGWTEHVITVTPSFQGFNLRISGRNQNDIKDYIHEQFYWALKQEIEN